jgi:hypothetical protein
MRLTLRTLLAWLDDTLDPNQVREIGKQVAESPFAQELSDRIHRVTRQRRLSVPSNSGAEAIDPNVVASYLDNDLDPDSVAEFEKRCLTTDVNLAEVASVHQILSLLGQKVQVPPEARSRMYQLVKGRETVARKRSSRRRPPAPEPVTKPIQPWVVPDVPKRPWIERFGPAVACLVLILLASSTAWWSLSAPSALPTQNPPVLVGGGPGEPVGPGSTAGVEKPEAPVGESSKEAAKVASAGDASQPESHGPEPAGPAPDADTAGGSKVAKASTDAKPKDEAVPVPAVPSGSAGLAEKADGLFLRYNTDKREWDRLSGATNLNRSDRLLCLTPFRSSITMGKMRITLVGETEVRIVSSGNDTVPALELVQGRLLIHQVEPNTLKVVFSNRTASLELAPESTVALERVEPRTYGRPITRTQALAACCLQGEVAFKVEEKEVVLKPSNLAMIDGGQVEITTPDSLPTWAAQAEPSPYELQVRDQFLRMFHPGRPVLAEIVGAIEDDRPEMKQLAISALKALGDLSLLMPILSREGDPVARRKTLESIRSYMALGPDAAKRVQAQLDEEFGENVGAIAYHMLVGYTPDEVTKGDIYPRLVGLLSSDQPSVGIRELALDTLKRLTGRDNLGYDPDHPSGKGLDAWNDLLRRNELKPLKPPAARTTTKAKAK